MQFTEWINKLKIKLFAPATICYRQMGQSYSVLKYITWLPAFLVFKNEPIGKDGYYKRLYGLITGVYWAKEPILVSWAYPRQCF